MFQPASFFGTTEASWVFLEKARIREDISENPATIFPGNRCVGLLDCRGGFGGEGLCTTVVLFKEDNKVNIERLKI